MGASRCSTCSVNYKLGVVKCPQCGDATWYSQTNTPDEEQPKGPPSGEDYILGSVDARVYDPVADKKIVSWRVQCFERLGFAATAATALAMRRDVDRVQVEDMLTRGARHTQVVTILL